MLGAIALPSLFSLPFPGDPRYGPFQQKFPYCSAPSDRKQNVSSFLGHYFIGGSFPVTAADETLGAAKKGRRVAEEKKKGGDEDKNRRKEEGK